MTQDSKYDVAIIGAGPGGYVAAIRAAQLGLKVICIDKRPTLGGTCLNVGCIPSKALLQSTELYSVLKHHGKEHGIDSTSTSIDFSQMMKRKREVVKSLVEGVGFLFKEHHIDFMQGKASFLDPHTIEVENDGQLEEVKADYFILATGSDPISLPDLPFDEKRVLSSTGALSVPSIPERMVVIGGGVIGVEIASVYSRIGSKVTVVEMLDQICASMDTMVSSQLLQSLKKQGIEFHLSTKVETAVVQPEEVILTLSSENKLFNLSANVVLVAIGRRSYTEGLNLDKIGITVSSKGFIPIDEVFRTAQKHVFAIGDIIEGPMLAHRASEEGVAVVEYILGHQSSINYLAIPNVIYTSPEAAAVGLTEKEAKEAGLDILVGTFSFKGNPRARCMGETEGFVKVIGDRQTGRLVGMHILGSHASEMIEEGMLAMSKKSTLEDIAHAAHAHPTLTEAIKEAALDALGKPIHKFRK